MDNSLHQQKECQTFQRVNCEYEEDNMQQITKIMQQILENEKQQDALIEYTIQKLKITNDNKKRKMKKNKKYGFDGLELGPKNRMFLFNLSTSIKQ
ncbi:hypothetical protein pb186bvf_002515 [Paramecium bursaria]